MTDKPSYLGLLNAISLAETRAHAYFEAWIAVTPNPDVRRVLQTVSYREGEHGLAFAKRINELGYELIPKDDPHQEQAMERASSDLPDVEKFRRSGLADIDLSVFDTVFSDHTIDIQTGALLGRYVAEEFDSVRRLRACYEALAAAETVRPDDRVDALAAQVDELCRSVEELQCAIGASPNGSQEQKRARR